MTSEGERRGVSPPWATSRLVRFHLTREGIFAVLIASVMLAAGLIKTINLLILIGDILFALILMNAYLAWQGVRRIVVARAEATPVFAGQSAVRSMTVSNVGPRSASVSVRESSPIHACEVFVPALPPGGVRRALGDAHPRHRGRYAVSPVAVECSYPFGFVRYARPATDVAELIVLPTVGLVDLGMLRRWLIRTGAGDARTRRPVRRQSPHQADVRGVRPYRPGDSPRDVHWRTTARRNELTVREYDSTEPLDLILAVDPWQPATASSSDAARVEAALSLAASVLWAWCHSDETPEVTLIVAGTHRHATARATFEAGRKALILLADAPAFAGPLTLPTDSLRHRSRRAARLLVTSRPGPTAADAVLHAAGLPFVILTPEDAVAWYNAPHGG